MNRRIADTFTDSPARLTGDEQKAAKITDFDDKAYQWAERRRIQTHPAEAAESLLQLATGGTPVVARISPEVVSAFDHPDAVRRFRVMTNVEELERALEFPWDKWTIFLHPEQRQWVEREHNGPAHVSGSAGAGKTIVAPHRAVFLARANLDARVMLTTFSRTLANALRTKLKRLVSHEPKLAERIDVRSIEGVGSRLYKPHSRANWRRTSSRQ